MHTPAGAWAQREPIDERVAERSERVEVGFEQALRPVRIKADGIAWARRNVKLKFRDVERLLATARMRERRDGRAQGDDGHEAQCVRRVI